MWRWGQEAWRRTDGGEIKRYAEREEGKGSGGVGGSEMV